MNSIKYYVKGTVKGSRCYDSHTEDIDSRELTLYTDEIKKLFTRDSSDELAQYICKDGIRDRQIYGIITEIWVDVKVIDGQLYSWTEITANRELTNSEKDALLDYLTGQFSDGYGEGLEQNEFMTDIETEECEEYDEQEDEYYTEEYEVNVSYYLHLWQAKDFKLEFVDNINESSNKEKSVSSSIKPRCKLIGEDGNIFNLIGLASRALRNAGFADKATEMSNKVIRCSSYEQALAVIMDYVEVM